MKINKAIRKQKKSYKRFMLTMSFIFLLLPSVLYFSREFYTFFIVYLVFIEVLIIIVMFIKSDKEYLNYKIDTKIRVVNGIFGGRYVVPCDKVEMVHTLKDGGDLRIIIVLRSKFRNSKIKLVGPYFLKRQKWIKKYYEELKEKSIFNQCYYFVIYKGGYNKYQLLDSIYRNCVQAHFTDDCIKRIKEYRE
ncbi:hypothetical protein [Clostridium botulinum]|uniref:Uncharacterized protein n=1 Tax=Clostridium botulinum TaxID=1491 RepID=A0A9Q1V0T9_CLOBO|nr:hypothetical protein [Clostridium botulinum]KEH98379.1 hypothetical protein Z953_00300 [Clostridium botulinum D str. 16868]KEI05120.1 hypothetical protein Y848_10085 [Clostridium botulinum C/D str. Sp77]KLU75392.1 hypothetical protein CBC3_08935 [Clostridium botulinum V891]KOA76248.1 hypothetical protein ADU78_06410 [Clostridium botulinum]KOA80025.1 hypothetical protein ADU77_02150 [Clostridium botulinum]